MSSQYYQLGTWFMFSLSQYVIMCCCLFFSPYMLFTFLCCCILFIPPVTLWRLSFCLCIRIMQGLPENQLWSWGKHPVKIMYLSMYQHVDYCVVNTIITDFCLHFRLEYLGTISLSITQLLWNNERIKLSWIIWWFLWWLFWWWLLLIL